jgi:hypothetical protein
VTVTHGFDVAAFDRLLGDRPIVEVFSALAGYYNRLAEQVREHTHSPTMVSRRLAKQFPLAEVELARDASRSVVVGCGEQDGGNDRESRRLLAQLQASLDAKRAG